MNEIEHHCLEMIKKEHVTLFVNEQVTKNFHFNNIQREINCYRYKEKGHYSRDYKNFYCYRCGQKNHLAINCHQTYIEYIESW